MIDPSQKLRGCRVAVIDLETTGAPHHRILEVGVVLIDRLYETPPLIVVSELVDPQCSIHWAAQQVHGIQAREVRGKRRWPSVWPLVRESLQDAVLCAYNAAFEHKTLSAEIARCGLEGQLPPVHQWLDPLRLVRHLDQPPAGAKGWHKLGAACARRELAYGRHRAAADAECTAHLQYLLLKEAYRREDVHPPPYATVAEWLAWQATLKAKRAPKRGAAPPAPPSSPPRAPRPVAASPAPKTDERSSILPPLPSAERSATAVRQLRSARALFTKIDEGKAVCRCCYEQVEHPDLSKRRYLDRRWDLWGTPAFEEPCTLCGASSQGHVWGPPVGFPKTHDKPNTGLFNPRRADGSSSLGIDSAPDDDEPDDSDDEPHVEASHQPYPWESRRTSRGAPDLLPR